MNYQHQQQTHENIMNPILQLKKKIQRSQITYSESDKKNNRSTNRQKTLCQVSFLKLSNGTAEPL